MNKEKPNFRCTVRMSQDEYRQLENDSQVLNVTKAKLLRRRYFLDDVISPKFDNEKAKRIEFLLSRIAGAQNQIAKKINSGVLLGWNHSFEEVLSEFKTLKKELRN